MKTPYVCRISQSLTAKSFVLNMSRCSTFGTISPEFSPPYEWMFCKNGKQSSGGVKKRGTFSARAFRNRKSLFRKKSAHPNSIFPLVIHGRNLIKLIYDRQMPTREQASMRRDSWNACLLVELLVGSLPSPQGRVFCCRVWCVILDYYSLNKLFFAWSNKLS